MKITNFTDEVFNNKSIFILYYIALITYAICSYFPENRIWGINSFSFLPDNVSEIILIIGIVWPAILLMFPNTSEGAYYKIDSTSESNQLSIAYLFLITIIFGLLYFFLKGNYHFLGDGYESISLLINETAGFKLRALGESLSHIGLYNLLGGGETSARQSYQLLSVIAGMLCVIAVIINTNKLLVSKIIKSLIILYILTSGYSLLFFGYIENYSLFSLTILCFVIFVKDENVNLLLIVIINSLAIFLHILGVALLPTTIYLLLRETRFGSFIKRLSYRSKICVTCSIFIMFTIAISIAYQNYIFIEYSIISPFASRFTVEGYTLLSGAHLLDMLNEIILLIPAIPLFFVFLSRKKSRDSALKDRKIFTLVILSTSCFLVLFLLDPKLGMARDWDLFAFTTIPVIYLVLQLALRNSNGSHRLVALLVLAVGLNITVLSARVFTQISFESAYAQVSSYFSLDTRRNMQYVKVVQDVCVEKPDNAKVEEMTSFFRNNYPEKRLNSDGSLLLDRNMVELAMIKFDSALQINPAFAAAYFNRGLVHMQRNRYVNAIDEFIIAENMNLKDSRIYSAESYAYYRIKDFTKAESYAKKSIKINGNEFLPYMVLAQLALARSDAFSHRKYILTSSSCPDAPFYLLIEAADLEYSSGKNTKGYDLVKKSIQRGATKEAIEKLALKYPELNTLLQNMK